MAVFINMKIFHADIPFQASYYLSAANLMLQAELLAKNMQLALKMVRVFLLHLNI